MEKSSSLQHTAANERLVTIDAAGCDEAICCIVVPNTLLLDLSTKRREGVSLVACINEHVVDEAIVLNPECARLEAVLHSKASAIANSFRRSKGRKKSELLKNSTRFTIYRGECLSDHGRAELAESLDSYIAITDELIANLVSDVEKMETELSWIHELENSGKTIDEVSMRQRKRKLEAVKGNAVKALSFTESYGLIADTLTAHTASGKRVRISLSDSDAQIEERKELEVLYLLDKYGVSDAFYHALSMECDSLPRASKIKAARSELNKTVELFSIPGFEGSYRHVETVREEIARLVSIYSIKISHDVIHVYILLMYRLHVRRFMLC